MITIIVLFEQLVHCIDGERMIRKLQVDQRRLFSHKQHERAIRTPIAGFDIERRTMPHKTKIISANRYERPPYT